MARKFQTFWNKLKKEKKLKISINREDGAVIDDFEKFSDDLRRSLSRCKSEDYRYREQCPHGKIRMEIESEDVINFYLDEHISMQHHQKIRLEDL